MSGSATSTHIPDGVTQYFGSGMRDMQFIASPVDPMPYADGQTILDTNTGDAYQVSNFLLGAVVFPFGTMRSFAIGDAASTEQFRIVENDTLNFDATGMANIIFADPLITINVEDAPSDGQEYVRVNGAWAVEADDGNDGIPDAPADSQYYVRFNNDWSVAPFIDDAPADGQEYVRVNNAWAVETDDGNDGIPDAPSDGTIYGRQNATWVDVASGGFLTAETDPDYNANTFATGMDQNVDSTASPTFSGMTINGKLTVTGEIDPTAIDFEQVATPAAPAASHSKIFFKTDRNLYVIDQDSIETQIPFINQVAALPVAIADLGDGSSNNSQWTNDSGFLDTETDPVFEAWILAAGAFANVMDQGVATTDAVTFFSIGYTPANGADWADADPTDVFAALDRLASAVAGLLATEIP